jgi:hypoxanthine phosphoribosyltransferase
MPLPEKFRCEILSWAAVIRDARKLAWMIEDSGYVPEIVIAIGRGGYVPARILCDYLLIRDLAAFKAEHWGTAAIRRRKAIITFPLCANIKGRRVLLVDDITDTGETLRVSLGYLKKFRPREIRTAVLLHKTSSAIIPDYFTRKIVKWRWITFPWHLWEDMNGFIEKLQAAGIRRDRTIVRELRERYCIDLPEEMVGELLSHLGAVRHREKDVAHES